MDLQQDESALQNAITALTASLAVWDLDNLGHCQRTADYAAALARELGVSGQEAEHVRIGALLHDIGKMGVDLALLRKDSGLDDSERARVQMHPAMGVSILERVLPEPIVQIAASHHEQPDGGGYPDGLTEEQTPIGALICRVADVFDSLTTDQSFRPAMTLEAALSELRAGAGTRYSARVVDALLALLDRQELSLAA
jgi:putative nucleotidyltransferase with HDIG domain